MVQVNTALGTVEHEIKLTSLLAPAIIVLARDHIISFSEVIVLPSSISSTAWLETPESTQSSARPVYNAKEASP